MSQLKRTGLHALVLSAVSLTLPQQPVAQPAQPAVEIPQVADGEKAKRTAKALGHMRISLSQVLKHLEDARDERDVVKLNCVNEKLTAIKGLLKISEQADVTMQEALARRNSESAQHEFEKIMIAQRKSDLLTAESEACVGELAVYSGDTQVEVIREGITEDDPSAQMPDVDLVVRPPAASPFQ